MWINESPFDVATGTAYADAIVNDDNGETILRFWAYGGLFLVMEPCDIRDRTDKSCNEVLPEDFDAAGNMRSEVSCIMPTGHEHHDIPHYGYIDHIGARCVRVTDRDPRDRSNNEHRTTEEGA